MLGSDKEPPPTSPNPAKPQPHDPPRVTVTRQAERTVLMAETRIREALELLRERGWCKDALEDNTGRLCIEGAIRRVVGEISFVATEDWRVLNDVARDQSDLCCVMFNDEPSTTFADVELVMEKAAVMREESVDG